MTKLLFLAIGLIVSPFTALAETEALDDAKIVAIVMAVNEAGINAGRLGQSTSSHPEVRTFSQRLASEHYEANALFGGWANRENVTPKSSSISENLETEEEQYLEKAKELSGILFDLDFIKHEVESHQQALDIWDEMLIPSARNEELKNLLKKMRLRLAGHLEHAKLIKSSLGRKK